MPFDQRSLIHREAWFPGCDGQTDTQTDTQTYGQKQKQNREAVHFFVLLFLVANLFLLLTVILLFVRAKTLYLMVIPDFSDYLGLSQPLKKKSSLLAIFFSFTESALRPIQSVSRDVRLFVCVSVRHTLETTLPEGLETSGRRAYR